MEYNKFEVLKNFGISGNIFNLNLDSSNKTEVYILKQEKIKKNFSEGAICKIPGSYLNLPLTKSKDDMELYEDCDQEYGVFGGAMNQKGKITFEEVQRLNISSAKSRFSSVFDNYNDFNYDLNAKKSNANINLTSSVNFLNSFDALRTEDSEGKEANCPKRNTFQTFLANENCENKVKNFKCQKIYSNENCNEIKNYNSKNYDQNSKNLINKPPSNILPNNINEDFNNNQENNILQTNIENKNDSQSENLKETANSEEELKNGILKNSMENQMEQLNRIFQEMNQSAQAKVIIKAYKSKLKTKFYNIYESNSEFYKEKNKNKIFHKCNFPGCSRTFASAGWLKSHFNEHLQQLKLNKFNIDFERSLMKLKHMNILQ